MKEKFVNKFLLWNPCYGLVGSEYMNIFKILNIVKMNNPNKFKLTVENKESIFEFYFNEEELKFLESYLFDDYESAKLFYEVECI